jgi:hypothetical protein
MHAQLFTEGEGPGLVILTPTNAPEKEICALFQKSGISVREASADGALLLIPGEMPAPVSDEPTGNRPEETMQLGSGNYIG